MGDSKKNRKSVSFFIAILALAAVVLSYQNCSKSETYEENGKPSVTASPTSAGSASIYDDPFLLSLPSSLAIKPGEEAVLTATLEAASESTLTFQYRTFDGSAVAGSDYRSDEGILVFAPGEMSKTIRITTLIANNQNANTPSVKIFTVGFGQFDVNTTASVSMPISIGSSGTAASTNQLIAAGEDHTCAIKNASLYCWGRNNYGQLGDGTPVARTLPFKLTTLDDSVTAVVANVRGTCVIDNNKVKCWGDNSYGQLGEASSPTIIPKVAFRYAPGLVKDLGSNVTMIAAGSYHFCAIDNGAAKCWGNNTNGELGSVKAGIEPTIAIRPRQVLGLSSGVTMIAAGFQHSCAIQNGALYCWGKNGDGQLGNGSTSVEIFLPVPVSGLGFGVTKVAVGHKHTCAIQAVNGAENVHCWGNNSKYSIGNDSSNSSSAPVRIIGITDAKDIFATSSTSCYRNKDSALFCWGDNSNGETGTQVPKTGVTNLSLVRTPQLVYGFSGDVASVSQSAGADPIGRHMCAFKSGDLHCWGRNNYAQVTGGAWASGSTTKPDIATKYVPFKVAFPPPVN